MYRSGLVSRRMAVLGLIGGPLIIVSGTAVLFNIIEPGSAAQFVATIPEFLWELSLGIYLMVKGFKPSPILSGATGDAGADERAAAPAWRRLTANSADPDAREHPAELIDLGRAPQ